MSYREPYACAHQPELRECEIGCCGHLVCVECGEIRSTHIPAPIPPSRFLGAAVMEIWIMLLSLAIAGLVLAFLLGVVPQ
jgi:hypothetical protein